MRVVGGAVVAPLKGCSTKRRTNALAVGFDVCMFDVFGNENENPHLVLFETKKGERLSTLAILVSEAETQ